MLYEVITRRGLVTNASRGPAFAAEPIEALCVTRITSYNVCYTKLLRDVRETSAGLVLDKELRGRFFIRDDDDHLVAELYKPQGRQMTIGLEAGKYKIHMSRDPELWASHIELHRKEMLVLLPSYNFV